jgi:uncharacterized Zn finger protein
MEDLTCPRCGQESLTRAVLRGKYICGSCGLAFGISGTDRKAINRGRRGVLARDPMSGKLRLKLVRRISVRTGRDLP